MHDKEVRMVDGAGTSWPRGTILQDVEYTVGVKGEKYDETQSFAARG